MSYADSLVFKPARYGSMSVRNRIAMAPMTRRKCGEDGVVTEQSVEYYRRRAAGEVGLIISEGVPVDSLHAADGPTVPHMETAGQIAAWKRVVDAVHEEGGAIAPQLWHTGPKAMDPIGPSSSAAPPRKDGQARPDVRAMEDADFEQVIEAFVSAARISREIGCNAIELHGAHGYLLDAFLCPGTNQRTDEYGGPIENRLRFPLEVVKAVRGAVGADYPILYRISQWKSEDEDKIKFRGPDDLEPVVVALREAGVDILHVSTERALDPAFPDVSDRTLAGWVKELSDLPTVAVGSVSLALMCNDSYGGEMARVADPGPEIELIEEGEADLLAVGRALISNPDWVQIVRDGDWRDLKPFAMSDLDTLA
ncbi:MAG: 12-oxophytodienoate reductase [Phycisphaerales bacterium]|nr:MAG: 12-oxophytodienoate reductase [Phycisphaerales bacterium]